MSYLLLVEDCRHREAWFRANLPARAPRLVVCPNGGRALGLLRRNTASAPVGILLDHDLTDRADRLLGPAVNGMAVADAVIRFVHRDVPVLVHSSNRDRGPEMATRLRAAGFDVTRIAFPSMTSRQLQLWVAEAQELVE
jgi:hypothetical protein